MDELLALLPQELNEEAFRLCSKLLYEAGVEPLPLLIPFSSTLTWRFVFRLFIWLENQRTRRIICRILFGPWKTKKYVCSIPHCRHWGGHRSRIDGNL